MKYKDFLDKVIEKGIEGVKRDYAREDQKTIRNGSIAGFKSCKNLGPSRLFKLLIRSRRDTRKLAIQGLDKDKYWFARGFELEVEWVCNVVSVILVNDKKNPIVPPTARATLLAHEILNGERVS